HTRISELTDIVLHLQDQNTGCEKRVPRFRNINTQKMKHYIAKIAVLILSGFAVVTGLRAGPTAADVGDAETFGHSALYMGAASGFETLSSDPCPAPTPTPSPAGNGDSFCDQLLPAPSQPG